MCPSAPSSSSIAGCLRQPSRDAVRRAHGGLPQAQALHHAETERDAKQSSDEVPRKARAEQLVRQIWPAPGPQALRVSKLSKLFKLGVKAMARTLSWSSVANSQVPQAFQASQVFQAWGQDRRQGLKLSRLYKLCKLFKFLSFSSLGPGPEPGP